MAQTVGRGKLGAYTEFPDAPVPSVEVLSVGNGTKASHPSLICQKSPSGVLYHRNGSLMAALTGDLENVKRIAWGKRQRSF